MIHIPINCGLYKQVLAGQNYGFDLHFIHAFAGLLSSVSWYFEIYCCCDIEEFHVALKLTMYIVAVELHDAATVNCNVVHS